MSKSKLWQGLATTTSVLLTTSIIASGIADVKASQINSWLGTSNYKVVETGGEATSDGSYFDSEYSTLEEMIQAQTDVAVQLAAEGSVLLKNNNEALPIDKETEKVTLWGLNSAEPVLGGLVGSTAAANAEEGQTAYGIEEAMQERGFSLNSTMMEFYAGSAMDDYRMRASFFGTETYGHALIPEFTPTYENPSEYFVGEAPADLYTDDVLSSADGTAAVVVISRDSSEAADYNPDMVNSTPGDSFERPLALSEYERDMIELAKEHSTKVIVLLNSDNPMEIEELKQDDEIDSILWTGAPGLSGFLGVADVLSGDENPSGHLSDTYAVNSTSSPAMVNFGVYTYENSSVGTGDLTEDDRGDWYLVESEGIYTGYKYYETRYEDSVLGNGNADAADGATSGSSWNYAEEVSYPFGYGLSYTTFEQKLNSVEVEIGGTGVANVTVTNTGDTAGKSVVELYVQAPYTEGGLEKSSVQLLDFAKTDVLEPGASETVTIEFDPQYIASYDEDYEKENGTYGAWVLEAGDYYFTIGNGAHEALNNILAQKQGNTDNLIMLTEEETVNADNALVWNLPETDAETYSVNVENALQDCDINNFIEDTVEYTTRSDWTKGWEPVESITATDEMLTDLKNQTYELSENGDGLEWGVDNGLKWIDFVLTDEDGNYTGVVDFNDERWDQLVDQVTLEEAVYFIENGGDGLAAIESIGFPYNAYKDGPVGFAFDQIPGYFTQWAETNSEEATYVSESDEYASYSMAVMPTEPVVASTWNKELVEREGEMFGEEGLWSNLVGIFGPGLNLHRNPYCARNHEYYSEDAMLTNLMGTAVCTGGKSKGLMMAPKHLAFNHQEMNRTGLSTFFTEQAGRENELRGFQGVMQSNSAMGIMTAFNRNGVVYAGGDEGVLIQIARNEWGYTGWITSDLINGANYQNWVTGMYGGTGTMLSNSDTYAETEWGTMESNIDEIQSDTVLQSKIKDSLKYHLYTIAQSSAINGIKSNTTSVYVRTWWQYAFLGTEIGLGVLTLLFAGLYVKSRVAKKKKQ